MSAVRVELWPCCTRKVARPNHQAPRHQSPTKCNGTWGGGKIGDEYKQTRELSWDPGMVQQSNDCENASHSELSEVRLAAHHDQLELK